MKKSIEEIIREASPLIVRCDLVDVFHCSDEEYYKIRREELKSKSRGSIWFKVLNTAYPYTKPLMEKLWGAVYLV